jgi:arylsulfatase B
MIWSWPNRLPRNGTHAGVVSSLDLLPTFLAAAEAKPLPLSPPRAYEDKRNRKNAVKKYGAYDGVNLLPQLTGKTDPAQRTLFWRLQGQTAILDGSDKLIVLSHRPAQMFRPAVDSGEAVDQFETDRTRAKELFEILGQWESTLATVPLWGSSPFWSSQSAKHYDMWSTRPEPE